MNKRYFTLATLFFLIFTALSFSPQARAESVEDSFELGNLAYTQGQYKTAIQHYKAARAQSGLSAALLNNLGSAYAEMGKNGAAILAYRQGLLLEHGNGVLRSNLASLRKKNGLYQEDLPLWQRFTNLLGADQWLLLCGFSFFIFSAGLLAGNLIEARKTTPPTGNALLRLAKYFVFLAAVSTVITLPTAISAYQDWNKAVVLQESRLLISPFATAASRGTIKEGRLIQAINTHNNFVLVTEDSGHKGWLQKKNIGYIKEF